MSQLTLSGIGHLADNVLLDTNSASAPTDDDLLVAFEAAPINPVDFLFAAGWYGVAATIGAPLGSEGVGRVVDAGPSADRSLVGRRVIVLANQEQGTWADRAIVPARNVVAIGDDGDATQLAQLSINPVTAHVLLSTFGDLQPGSWIGQTLGNSGVGQYVTQLARRAGYHTISVVRSEQAAARVRAAGGDVAITAADDLAGRIAAELDGSQFDLVLDGEGGATVGKLAQSLKSGGTVASYSAITGAPPVIELPDLIFREIGLRGWWLVNWLRTASQVEIEATYAELAQLIARGELSSTVEATYPLSSYREAIANAARSGRSGKVLFAF